jgi:hypothetical protein
LTIPNTVVPWYKRARRWGQTNLTEIDPGTADLGFWKDQWRLTRVQGVIINASGIVSYYPSQYPLQYHAAGLNGRDYFKEFADAARECGLAVIARMDLSRTDEAFYRAHPEWFCRDLNGEPFMSQGRYFTCVNSGYYKEYIPLLLREIIQRYSPDGFADNNWKGLPRECICRCANCEELFRERFGMALPERADYADPAYRAWIRWSYDTRTANWRLFNDVTREAGGADCLWRGMVNADPSNPSGSFCDLKAVCERSEFIFCDHQGRDKLNGFEQNNVNGAVLRMLSGEDTIVAESIAQYVRLGRIFRLAANPAVESRLWMTTGAAGGISPWFHHISAGTRDRRQFGTPVPFFQWHEQNEEYLYDRISLANVALVWSRDNADFYGQDNPDERVSLPWRGFSLALSEGRIPFIPINADHTARYADRIKTLILPDLAVLTETQTDAVIAHLEKGGGLVLSGNTGTLDADGMPRQGRLLDYLGLRFKHGGAGSGGVARNWENSSAHTYLLLPGERHPILKGLELTDIVGYGGNPPTVASTGALRSVSGFIPAFPVNPPEFAYIREEQPERGTIFAGTLPTGSRVVYFAADIDRCYGRTRLPDHGMLLRNAIRWVAGDSIKFNVDCDGYIDASFYAQGDRRIVHLVNLTGANLSPGYCQRCTPIGSVAVDIPFEGAAVCRRLVAGGRFDAQTSNGMARVILDSIVDHEVLVIEPKG